MRYHRFAIIPSMPETGEAARKWKRLLHIRMLRHYAKAKAWLGISIRKARRTSCSIFAKWKDG